MNIADTLYYFQRAARFALLFGCAFLGLRILAQIAFKRPIHRGRECMLFVFTVYLTGSCRSPSGVEGPTGMWCFPAAAMRPPS